MFEFREVCKRTVYYLHLRLDPVLGMESMPVIHAEVHVLLFHHFGQRFLKESGILMRTSIEERHSCYMTCNCTLEHCIQTLCTQINYFKLAHGRQRVLNRPAKTPSVEIFIQSFTTTRDIYHFESKA